MILWDYTAQYLGASHNPLEILQPVSRGRGEANTVATHLQGSHPHGPLPWIQRPGLGGHERSTGDLHRHRVSGGVFVEATMVGTRSYKQDTLQSIKIWNTHDLSIIFWTGKPWVSISMLICQRVTRDSISWGTSITKVFPSALPNYRTAHQETWVFLYHSQLKEKTEAASKEENDKCHVQPGWFGASDPAATTTINTIWHTMITDL